MTPIIKSIVIESLHWMYCRSPPTSKKTSPLFSIHPLKDIILNTIENKLLRVINILNTVVYQDLYQLFILTEYVEIIRCTRSIICQARDDG